MVLDPRKCSLYPEIHAEAGVITATEGGAEICSHTRINPFLARLKSLATSRDSRTSIQLAVDGGSYIIDSRTSARQNYDVAEDLDIVATKNMVMQLKSDTGEGNITGQIYRYSLMLTQPTIFDKIKYGMRLSAAEAELDTRYGVSSKINSGIMRALDPGVFESVREVAVKITAAVDANPIVYRELHALQDKKVVLLGITSEPAAAANSVYLRVDRDDQSQLQQYDTYAFTADFEQELYIPALDKLKITLVNTAAVTDMLIRIRYAVAPLTLIEKIRWVPGWTYEVSADERDLIDELGLDEIAQVGAL